MTASRLLTLQEVSSHNTPTDAWIVVNGKVYDVTEFMLEHPGGAEAILQYAGKDASKAYNEVHALSIIETQLQERLIGNVCETPEQNKPNEPHLEQTKKLILEDSKPPLATIINTYDFEEVASKTVSKKTWAFYSSAATDLITRDLNKASYDRIFFRPRVLRNVTKVDTQTTMLGQKMSLPLFVAPAAMAKMIHPEGEKALARGVTNQGIIQCVSNNASFPLGEIISSAPQNHPFFFQLYVNKDRKKSEKLMKDITALDGIKAIFVTVDAPAAGKREADEKVAADESLTTPMGGSKARNDRKGGGLGRTMGQYVDPSLTWNDIPWLRSITSLPIGLKGIQTAADAKIAMEYGIDAIMLSNHGGRSLDTSPPAIFILLELHKTYPEVFTAMEIYIDGGIRRGTDILKALCLGAKAVGLGRPFLYALNYGHEGVEHLVEILRDELETSMRMVGITNLAQAHPGLVNTLGVDHLIPGGEGHQYAKQRPVAKL
ncbi:hypothetical protein FGG08_001886 [Glutinoglossum americanum]|uniref:L-lactate dehydrogenase (cytochrome) n=1 Tax=Glutinoglossum americanum TaxID=1670608 RepID=A0A9P8KZS1_9PEZI|nr:hypothetical protein FGG08_001886 [Glutinoglossum americanum]